MTGFDLDTRFAPAPTTAERRSCPMCGCEAESPFISWRAMPVFCNVLWDTPQKAMAAAKGNIELSNCRQCGLVFNAAFDERLVDYVPGYENALHFSAKFRSFADQLSQRLIADYELRDGLAVEIGCGDGQFLQQMLQNGMRKAVGFDPSVPDARREEMAQQGVELVPEYFNAEKLSDSVAIVICRHVLEHVSNPLEWLSNIRRAIGHRRPIIYFEVPNGDWLLKTCNPWDVIYEHVTYWTPESLRRLFRTAGFKPLATTSGFGEQYLMLEARPDVVADAAGHADDIGSLCNEFTVHCSQLIDHWQTELTNLHHAGRQVVVWGAGSKGISFLNLLADAARHIRGLVDVNPRKHGKYVAGLGLPVLAPEDLIELQPDTVLVMNAIYVGEVQETLAQLGLNPELEVAMLPEAAIE